MVGFRISCAFGGWVRFRVRVLVQEKSLEKSSHVTGDCALASDLVKAVVLTTDNDNNNAINLNQSQGQELY